MSRISFSSFSIMGLAVIVLVPLFVYYLKRVNARHKQILVNDKEEIKRLSEIIETERITVQRLENENRLMLERINQAYIAQCKNHPLLKRMYDKNCVSSVFSEVEWKEFMLAFLYATEGAIVSG